MARRRDIHGELASSRFNGPYARDTYDQGFGGDYTRDEHWGGTRLGRGTAYVGYGPARTRGDLGGSAEAYAEGRPSYRGRGPKNYKRSDDRIADEVNEALTEDELLDASDIEVSVENGEVTLSGTVTSRHAKRRAEDLAESCSGVIDVHNRLKLTDRETVIGKASE